MNLWLREPKSIPLEISEPGSDKKPSKKNLAKVTAVVSALALAFAGGRATISTSDAKSLIPTSVPGENTTPQTTIKTQISAAPIATAETTLPPETSEVTTEPTTIVTFPPTAVPTTTPEITTVYDATNSVPDNAITDYNRIISNTEYGIGLFRANLFTNNGGRCDVNVGGKIESYYNPAFIVEGSQDFQVYYQAPAINDPSPDAVGPILPLKAIQLANSPNMNKALGAIGAYLVYYPRSENPGEVLPKEIFNTNSDAVVCQFPKVFDGATELGTATLQLATALVAGSEQVNNNLGATVDSPFWQIQTTDPVTGGLIRIRETRETVPS